MCKLKGIVDLLFVTQFVHNKFYNFIKKYKREEIHLVFYYNCMKVNYNDGLKHNKDFLHLFEKFQFHFKLCDTGVTDQE